MIVVSMLLGFVIGIFFAVFGMYLISTVMYEVDSENVCEEPEYI